MDLVRIYQCFCDRTRLRIIHLLTHGPLCVCHFQDLLGEPQVKISKHLAYLKRKGLVTAHRHQNWIIYCVPAKAPSGLEKNLRCLQDCAMSDAEFKADLRRLKQTKRDIGWIDDALRCCVSSKTARNRSSGLVPKDRTMKTGGAACC